MKEIGIGLLGFGTVGAGVVEGLQRNSDLIAKRMGIRPVLRKIADIDLKKDRGVKVAKGVLTTDALAVIDDPSVDIIVELIGGTKIAKEFIVRALKLGKPVVTANKALLAHSGTELFKLAAQNKTSIWFEASVGGGIPIIHALREGLIANRINRMYGILNGTCNYILTRMEQEQASFDEALKAAQESGYAEADPSFDVDGIDTAHKAIVLGSLAHGFPISMKSVYIEGIRRLVKADMEHASSLGYRIKLLAVIKNEDGKVEIRVQPTLIPKEHMLASVSGVYNAVFVEGDVVGKTLYYGRGAGRLPTASAVISDIADACRAIMLGGLDRLPAFSWEGTAGKVRDVSSIEERYYLRVSLLNKPGALGKLTTLLGKHNVSIASVLQKETDLGKYVSAVIVTHKATEKSFRAALKAIDAMDVVGAKTVMLRIEDLA